MSVALAERPTVFESAVRGDADSFSRVLEPLLEQAYRLAAVMLDDRAAAEDVVQEASVKAWRKVRQLRGDERSLRPWFLSIVANECRMMRRTRWWSVVKLADVVPSPSVARETYADLHRALLKLSPDDRLALVLHFYLDLPLDELARTLHISASAAKSRVYRAARRMRADLTIEEVF